MQRGNMVSNDYWDKDELDDRLYYARQREKQGLYRTPASSGFTWRLRRTRVLPVLFGIVVLLLWQVGPARYSSHPNWSRHAYSQYTTDTQSLCNSLMVFESLHKLGSKADRVLLYPKEWLETTGDINWWMLHKAERDYRVKLIPVDLLGADLNADKPGTFDDPSSDWDLSITKLQVFELVQYDRVLHLDSDITLLQHLDELFSLPKAPIAMPRAYWSDGPPSLWPFTSLVMLVEPDSGEMPAMMEILRQWQQKPDYSRSKKYDMDLLNHRFALSTTVLPHRPYAMLTAEFRSKDHRAYMNQGIDMSHDESEIWDPDKALKEAKLVHFSDWPLPKPWIMWPNEGLVEMQPQCDDDFKGRCREREIWKELYEDFRRRRSKLCKISPVPAPNWQEWKNKTGAG
ncbi:uncharacterized protein PV09_09214 [Verruconis gallopava]|uniref:Glucose N-acetyltransferase 1 n=1 Tax=Verruconis gallopava TaxID=253628 RepID=A0A0D1ZY91_9PEZI|nr:uncharacterized protein PV09_09214 [Verruconis gallopava]KIV99039.1 hypothetical protein PV09_09214 [Verruconis gallopava]